MKHSRTRLKICGITTAEDALAAAELGADYLGFVCVSSSARFIAPERIGEIARKLPRKLQKVLVTLDMNPEKILGIMRKYSLDVIQLHGSESPECVFSLFREYPVWKALPCTEGTEEFFSECSKFPGIPLLLDSKRAGSGTTCDWDAAKKIVDSGREVILAGGIGPDNLERAVSFVRPAVVDLSSAVESSPGRKDPEKLAALSAILERIHSASSEAPRAADRTTALKTANIQKNGDKA